MRGFGYFQTLKNIITSREKKRNFSANINKQNINTYKCKEHNNYFNKICLKCHFDICPKCEKNMHRMHQTIKYEEIIPDDFEIKNLQNKLKDYLDTFEFLRKDINDWFNEIKRKINSFEQIFNKNEIKNSYEFIMNYSYKTPTCFDSIYKFRKIYNNLIETKNNNNNKNIFQTLSSNYENDILPQYLSFQKIKSLLHNLNINQDNQIKKSELILDYLNSFPLLLTTDSDKYNSLFNYKKTETSISPIEKLNSNSICDKSTGNDKNNNNNINEEKVDEFKKLLSKTIISDFNVEKSNKKFSNSTQKSNQDINSTFSFGKKKYNISTFTKYLNEMGLISTSQDLHKVNSSQDLLSKTIKSIKSTKYINTDNNINNNNLNLNNSFIYKKQNNVFKTGTKSEMNSPKVNNNIFKINYNVYNTIKKIDYNNKNNWYNHPLLTSKKTTQMKTFVHKKLKNTLKNSLINNEIFNTEIKKENNFNIDKKIIKSSLFNNNEQDINKKDDIGQNNIKKIKKKIYEKPLQQELFKYNTINNIKNKDVGVLELNEQNSFKTTNKNNLLNLIYSPSNTDRSKNNQNISKINKINFNNSNPFLKKYTLPFTITKQKSNSKIKIDPKKDLYIGLELGDSETKIGIINQNLNEIQLINFSENNNEYYSIPTIISFLENKKEIKIGKEAEKDLLTNPSQTIFNIVKYFGKKMKDIKLQNELLPFKLYSANDEKDKPFIKINHGPQKDKIIYMEHILSIYLQKIFEIFIHRIIFDKVNKNTNIQIILVIAVPNHYNFYQRKLLQEIFKQEVIPKINNEQNNNPIKINFVIEKIEIKNSASIASISLTREDNNNVLIFNIDRNCSNISLVSINKEIIKIKASTGLEKGENDIMNDFMLYLLKNRLNEEIKNDILNSSFAFNKFRILCNKIKNDLLNNENTSFNLKQILTECNSMISVNKNEYENCLYNFIYDLKQELKKIIENKNLFVDNSTINKIIYVGKIFEDEKIKINIEQLLKEKNISFEEIIFNEDLNKEYITVGGASYYAMNIINNSKYSFQDISNFNLGIKAYNDTLLYLIKKGDIIPIKSKSQIKLKKNSEIELYEENSITKNKILIAKFNIDNIPNYIENKLNYNEITIEYEIDKEMNIKMRLFNGKNFSKELNCNLYIYNS